MPDISMCLNKTCPSYTRCWRAQARPSMRQAWTSFIVLEGNMRCEEFKEMRSQNDRSRAATTNTESL
jgi:hypothetical protein